MMALEASRLAVAIFMIVSLASMVKADYNQTEYMQRVFYDNSNDDAIRLSPQELLVRSGFQYETHYVIAPDGYISTVTRIINPKANRSSLHPYPFIIFHGANIDPSCYLIASSIQHHPEPYPRTAADGPFTSSNRSLGFVLPNNGFDTWLVGIRASNLDNQRWTNNSVIQQQIRDGDYSSINDPSLYDYAKTSSYWQYGIDNVIPFEVKLQIDKVLNVTNQTQFYIYSYSLSTPTTLAFLTQNPDYARNTRVYFQMAPAIAATHFSSFDLTYFEKLCPLFPTRGAGFFPSFLIQPLLRELLIGVSISPQVKYSLIYELTTQIFGPSPLYNTNLERNIISHTFQPVSFKTVQQYCQNSAKNFTKFDYTAIGNPSYYGQTTPPLYNISNLEVQQWSIVHGTNDGLASLDTVRRLISIIRTPNPVQLITAKLYNHLDMIAGTEVDKMVNLPVLALALKYA